MVAASTIAGGRAARGRGVWVEGTTTLRIDASILDHGGERSCDGDQLPWGVAGDHNLVGDATCALTGVGNVEGSDPLLGVLADNGGPTWTRLPGVGSLAIDAIAAGTGGLCDGAIATDQRGVARPTGVACDAGAVEQ